MQFIDILRKDIKEQSNKKDTYYSGRDGTAAYTRMYCSLYPDVLQLIPDRTAAYIIKVRIKLPQSS